MLLPRLLLGLVGVELGHHLAGEEIEALADVLVRVLAGLVQEQHLVDVRGFEPLELAPDRLGRADQAAGQRPSQCLGVGALPFLVFVPQIDRAGLGPLAHRAQPVKAQGELKERDAVGTAARPLVGLGAHEIAGQCQVRVGLVVGQLVEALGESVVVGVDPGMRRLRAQELKGERAQAAASGHLDRLQLRAGAPQWRVRLLRRLGDDVAQWEIEIGAVVFAAAVPEHRDDRAHRVFPHRAFFLEAAAERFELGDAGALAHAEIDAAAADEIERGDAFGDPRRVAGGQLHDAVSEADLLGALARRAEEHFRCGRVRILFEKMVLDLPGIVVAEPVGQFELVERIVVEPQFAAGLPRARQLQFVEYAELHPFLLGVVGSAARGTISTCRRRAHGRPSSRSCFPESPPSVVRLRSTLSFSTTSRTRARSTSSAMTCR